MNCKFFILVLFLSGFMLFSQETGVISEEETTG
jgi:hypothetical protein